MSKTIYLFRHSVPAVNHTIPASRIPLSYEGIKKITGITQRFDRIAAVYASPYLSAVQTAEAFGRKVQTDKRLRERMIGRPEAFTKEFWEQQYRDRARACLKKAFRELRVPVCGRFYPNEGGVAGYGNRMRVKYTAKWGLQIAEMLFQTRSKARRRGIVWNDRTLCDGPIPMPSYFVLTFEDGKLVNLDYHIR